MRTMAFGPAILVGALMGVGAANAMTVTSPDIKPGGKIADEQVFNGWDCTGKNVSPALSWSGRRRTRRASPSACTIPTRLPAAASGTGGSPIFPRPSRRCRKARAAGPGFPTARSSRTTTSAWPDMAARARPRASRIAIVITVFALKVDKLDVDDKASPAVFGFYAQCEHAGEGDAHRPLRAVRAAARSQSSAAPLRKKAATFLCDNPKEAL